MTDFRITLLSLMLVLAGCNAVTEGPETATHDPVEEGSISISPVALEYNESFYHENGSITYTKASSVGDETFQDLTLCLYDEEGNVINSTVVGDLSGTVDTVEYEISAKTRPHYLTFDHPRFHDYDLMRPLTIQWTEHERYSREDLSLGKLQDDFEYPRHNETGRCL